MAEFGIPLRAHVLERCRVHKREAEQKHIGLRVGQRTKPVVVFLTWKSKRDSVRPVLLGQHSIVVMVAWFIFLNRNLRRSDGPRAFEFVPHPTLPFLSDNSDRKWLKFAESIRRRRCRGTLSAVTVHRAPFLVALTNPSSESTHVVFSKRKFSKKKTQSDTGLTLGFPFFSARWERPKCQEGLPQLLFLSNSETRLFGRNVRDPADA